MKQGIFSGCGTALVTPFLMDGSVDWDSLDRLVEAQLAGGVSCLVAAGTTGGALGGHSPRGAEGGGPCAGDRRDGRQ